LQFRNTETKFRLHQQLTGILMFGNNKLNETQRRRSFGNEEA